MCKFSVNPSTEVVAVDEAHGAGVKEIEHMTILHVVPPSTY